MRTLLQPASTSPALTDLVLLVSRVALGVILLAHGWQKLHEYTLDGTSVSFGEMGIPVPAVAATVVTLVEIVGGVALVIGLLTPVVALLNTLTLLGALVLVHASNGVFVDNGGFELVLALLAGLLPLVVLGAGKFSADTLLRRSTTTASPTAASPAR
ncbi:DoxX family protein [Rhodococcus aetherivorans]|uniref:DoxX family protein n=1 Tax=Rhodococcus aetherivorans TaxID=191292 RepID=UPI00367E5591